MEEAPKNLDEGFTKPINVADLDSNFKYEVASSPGGKTLLSCFQCSNCTAGCPISAAVEAQPHQIIRMTILGMRKEVLNSKTLWLCSTCFACNEGCPQGVKVCDVLFALKNIASTEVGVPTNLKVIAQNIHKFGRVYEIGELEDSERELLSLPSLPKVDKDAIKRIMKKNEFDKLIEAEG